MSLSAQSIPIVLALQMSAQTVMQVVILYPVRRRVNTVRLESIMTCRIMCVSDAQAENSPYLEQHLSKVAKIAS